LSYENNYVAVHNKSVIDSDPNLQELLKRLESNQVGAWNTLAVLHINRERSGF
jgi:hypothetical protein